VNVLDLVGSMDISKHILKNAMTTIKKTGTDALQNAKLKIYGVAIQNRGYLNVLLLVGMGNFKNQQEKNAMTQTLNRMMDVVLNVLLKRATAVEKV